MTSSSRNLNIKNTHGGFDVRAGGDEKQKINFAWPYMKLIDSESEYVNIDYLWSHYPMTVTSNILVF